MKRNQKRENVADTVIRERKNLLDQIKRCQSLNALGQLEYGFNNDSRYATPKGSRSKTSVTMSIPQLQEYVRLGNEINEALEAQKNKLKLGLTQPVAESSVRSEYVDLVEEGSRVEPLLERVEESITSHFQELRKIAISHIEDELVNVAKKCERMSKKGAAYEKATLATQNIHDAITNLVAKYVQDGDAQHFQDETKALFDETTEDMKTINEHRGWAKNFFGNLAYFILGAGVGYAAVCAYRGKFFEFNTETANVVGVVNEKITALTQGLI